MQTDRLSNVTKTRQRPRKHSQSGAFLAAGSISLGVIAALISVPNDVSRPDALFWPALYLAIALLAPIAPRVRAGPTAVLRIENALMVGLVYWLLLDLLQSAFESENVAIEDVQYALLLIGAFAFAVWLGSSGQGWALPRVVAASTVRQFSANTLFAALLAAFVLGIAKYAIASGFDIAVMVSALGGDRWSAPWARSEFGGTDAFLDHMQYFGFILPSLCVLLALRAGWGDWRVILGLILSLVVIAFLSQGGGRRIIGVVCGAAIFTWLASQQRLNPKILIGGGIAAVMLLAFLQEMLRYRNVGFGVWWEGGEQPELIVSHLHVDDNFLRLAQLINIFPKFQDYVLYQPLLHAITLPVPRVLWPGKPLGPGFDLVSLQDMEGLSLSYSIVGELYVSFGIWAVLAGGWIIGRIAGMWNKIMLLPVGDSRPLMLGLGAITLFAGLRSMQALVQMSYIVLAWLAIAAVVTRR